MELSDPSSIKEMLDSKYSVGLSRKCFQIPLKMLKCTSRIISCCFSVQNALSLLMLGSMLSLFFSLHFIFDYYSSDNIKTVFRENQDKVLDLVENQASQWLTQGFTSLNVLEKWLKKQSDLGLIDLDFPYNATLGVESKEAISVYGRKVVLSQKNISAIGFGGKRGNLVGIRRISITEEFYTNESSRPEECCWYTWNDLLEGTLEGLPGPINRRTIYDNFTFGEYREAGLKHYDYRLLPWYDSARGLNPNEYSWVNLLTTLNTLSSNIAKSFYDSDGVFRGVLSVWFELSDFNYFLSSLKLDLGILVIIDERDGNLLASSLNTKLYKTDDNGFKYRTNPLQSEIGLLRGMAKFLMAQQGRAEEGIFTCSDIDSLGHLSFTLDEEDGGGKWYLSARSVNKNSSGDEEDSSGNSSTKTLSISSSSSNSSVEERELEAFNNNSSGPSSFGGMTNSVCTGGSDDFGFDDDDADEIISPSNRSYHESIYSLKGNRFNLGLETAQMICCCCVSIVNWKQVMCEDGRETFNLDYGILLNRLSDMIGSRCTFLSFGMKEIVMYYRMDSKHNRFRSSSCGFPFSGLFPFFFGYAGGGEEDKNEEEEEDEEDRTSIESCDDYYTPKRKRNRNNNKKKKKKNKKKKSLKELKFKLVVGIAMEFSVCGVVGNRTLKHHAVQDGAVEKAKCIINCYKNSRCHGPDEVDRYERITILMDSQVEKRIKETCLEIGRTDVCSHLRPLNIFLSPSQIDVPVQVCFERFLLVYEFCIKDGLKMLKRMRRKMEMSSGHESHDPEIWFENLRIGFFYLIHGKNRTARKYLVRSVAAGEGISVQEHQKRRERTSNRIVKMNENKNKKKKKKRKRRNKKKKRKEMKGKEYMKYIYDVKAEKLLKIVRFLIENDRAAAAAKEEEGITNRNDLIVCFEEYIKGNTKEISDLENEGEFDVVNRSLIYSLHEKEKKRKKIRANDYYIV